MPIDDSGEPNPAIGYGPTVERAVPAGWLVHAILDNYVTHKHPAVRDRLADHPRWNLAYPISRPDTVAAV